MSLKLKLKLKGSIVYAFKYTHFNVAHYLLRKFLDDVTDTQHRRRNVDAK